jgi:predicted  nucleic acid-binding Zn-ribbon protein
MKREAYLDKFKAQLDGWNADIDHLEAKVREASADAKIKYERQISSIRERMSEARGKAAEIQNANENAWEDLRQGAEDAWNRLKHAMEDAKANLK